MSIVDIIASRPQLFTFDGSDVGFPFISADVTLSEEYSFENEVTQNPVESGIDVVDHKRPKPQRIRMSGFITDSPNDALDVLNGNVTGLIGSSADLSLNPATKRSQDGYQILKELARLTTPITIVTHIDTFQNFTIETIAFKKNDAGEYISFDAVCLELRFAQATFAVVTAANVAHTAPKKPTAAATAQPLAGGSVLGNSVLPAAQKAIDGISAFFRGL